MFLILICTFFNLSWSAPVDFNIEGEGRFISQEGDSLPFIKEQLLFNAFQDVITKYLKRQGLNSELFWEKHDQRFEAFFARLEGDIKKANQDPSKLEKEIRYKKLERKSQFGLLNRSIKSYTISSMTRAQNMPNARYININAQVDSNLINQIYFDYVSTKKMVKGLNLYLLPIFTLSNMSWTDLGVNSEKDFSSVVSDHWKKHLEDDLKPQIGQVIIMGDGAEKELRRVLESKQSKKGFLEIADSTWDSLESSFLLIVKIKIKKVSEKILLKKNQLEIGLNFGLIDLKSGKTLVFDDLAKTKTNFSTEDLSQLSSSVATSIYRMPLDEFGTLKRNLSNNLGSSNLLYLKVSNLKSVEDLMGLSDTLKTKGVSYQLKPRIYSLKANEGILELEFNGSKTQAEQFLKSIENEKLYDGREVSFGEEDGNFVLAIKNNVPSSVDQDKINGNKKRVVL